MSNSYVLYCHVGGLAFSIRQALPITCTLEILDKFYDYVNFNSSTDVTYGYIFIFALFLLSRKSNLVPVSVKMFDSSRQLCI